MKTELIREIEQSMLNYLDNAQLEILHKVLLRATENLKVIKNDDKLEGIEQQYSNEELISKFINAKQIEGCSDKTIKYYKSTLLNLLKFTLIHINHLTTDDLREYLSEYQK